MLSISERVNSMEEAAIAKKHERQVCTRGKSLIPLLFSSLACLY